MSLQCDPRVDERGVGVNVHNGVVTLVGSVPHCGERVVNSTTLETARRAEAPEEIAEAQRLNTSLETQHIVIAFKDGAVSLRGCVESDQQRNDAALMAWTVPGVSEVENLLVVQPKASGAY